MNLQAETYADNIPHALFGFIITLALIIFGLINLRFFGVSISLIWLPLMGVFLWPRFAAPVISVILIFIAGILQDILNAQSTGFSSILFLLVYVFLRPRLDFEDLGLATLWTRFGGVVALTIGLILLFKVFGNSVSISNFPLQVLVTLLTFPIFLSLRTILRRVFIPLDRL